MHAPTAEQRKRPLVSAAATSPRQRSVFLEMPLEGISLLAFAIGAARTAADRWCGRTPFELLVGPPVTLNAENLIIPMDRRGPHAEETSRGVLGKRVF